MKIKFGTDGWRAIIAKEYTVDNVARVTVGVAEWLNANFENPSVVVGHDCRFAGQLFTETTAKVLTHHGVKVTIADRFVSTPMLSLAVVEHKADLGVVITASHNPPEYNGYKLKGNFGGPLLSDDIQAVEDLIPDTHGLDLNSLSLDGVDVADFTQLYLDKAKQAFDLDAINNSGLQLGYDAMYGAGREAVPSLLPKTTLFHCSNNPGFNGTAPEPIHRNLTEFSDYIKITGEIDCGLATDGDADRIGLYNAKGEFIDSHHIILLLIHYLVKYKGMSGKIVTAFSCSVKVEQMCAHYGLEHEIVKVGFKHVAGVMLKEDVLLGGEESGGVAIKGHIPERDGIWMGLVIWEYMAKTGKSLDDLIQEVYDIVGEFAFERIDLHLQEAKKLEIVENCKQGVYTAFGDMPIVKTETIDGFKYYFDEDSWIMIRPSGTEPVLRTYAEAKNQAKCFEILEKVHKSLLD
ncbi:MAG: phosphoglucomutase/phosphomannomutase family protein [Flavobacteriales bacterium]|nr:phosphoglucomutase/phosphomannomutase family protein [Flavobacteriales bacterium]MBL6873077.1 phosphoglucomutase/phosphomannomutase family protein [Flavobacteriales bacterium]